MGESRDGQKQKLLPIIRCGNGKFFGFDQPEAAAVTAVRNYLEMCLNATLPETGVSDPPIINVERLRWRQLRILQNTIVPHGV